MKFFISLIGFLLIVFSSYSQKYNVYWDNNVGFNSCSTGGSVVTQFNKESWKRYNDCGVALVDTLNMDGAFTINALPLALYYYRGLRIYSIYDGRPSICSFSLQYGQELGILDLGKIKHYIINDNANPGFSCSFSGSNVSGSVEIGISPPSPDDVLTKNSDEEGIVTELEGKTIILSNYYNSGDYNTTNNPISNFTYEIQISSNSGKKWDTYCSGQPLDGTVPYTLPDVVTGPVDTILFRSRIHRINGVSPVDYSPWSVPTPFTVCDFPDVTITPASSKCVGAYGGTTTIQFNVGPFDPYLKYIDIYYLTTKDGSPWDEPLVGYHTIAVGSSYTSLPMAAGTYTIKIKAKDVYDKILSTTYTINQPPATPSYSSGSLTPCVNSTQTYTVTGVGVDSYNWSFPADWTKTSGGTSNSATFTVGNSSGTKSITVTPSNSCATATPKNLTFNVNVNPFLPASVNIVASPTGAVCAGASVTFTATPTNGGTTPVYQWYANGSPVGTNNSTYTFIPTNGQTVKCVMTSNATPCLTGSPATSNTITTTVNPLLPASVSIVASPASEVCTGTSITFTATPTNGGTAPVYQWKVNGLPVATGSTYTFIPINGQTVTCTMTSKAAPCLTGSPATSNAITMKVNPFLPASVSISASPIGEVCTGTSVTFTATPTNGGSVPIYQWKVNGLPVGTNSNTYTFTPINGQIVSCVMTSNATPCLTGSPATSNSITMMVSPVSVGGNISSNQIICYNDTPQSLTLSGNTGNVLKWKQSTDPSFTSYTEFNETSNTLSGTSIGALIATTYFRAVVKSGTCSETESSTATITVNPSSVGGSINPQDQPVCYGDIPSNLILSGFTGNIVKWQKSSNSDFLSSADIAGVLPSLSGTTIGSLTSKTYFRAVVKSGVCPESYSELAIANINPLPDAIVGSDRAICYGSSTTIGADVVAGSTYSWTSNPAGFTSTLANPTVSPTVAITYTVVETITATGCSKSNSVTVTINPKPILGSPSLTNIDCYGSSTGQIAITASGGISPYSYTLTGEGIIPKTNTDGLFTNLSAATNYSITVTDINLCAATLGNITITQPSEPFILSVNSLQNVKCPSGSDGLVELKISGGTPNYKFSMDGSTWLSSAYPYEFKNLTANSYTFWAEDSKGCQALVTQAITQPDPITSTAEINNVTCKGESSGKLSFSVLGGTGLYNLALIGPNSYNQTESGVAQKVDFGNLAFGRYTLTISDSRNCELNDLEYDVLEPSIPLSFTEIPQDPRCKGSSDGEIHVAPAGGWGRLSYSFANLPSGITYANGKYSGLGKGVFSINLADSLGCIYSKDVTLAEPTLLTLSTPITTNLLCNGDRTGSIEIAADGGTPTYNYMLTGEGISPEITNDGKFLNLPAASNYSITVTDNNGCTTINQAVITEPETLKLNLSNTRDDGFSVNCTGGVDSVWVTPLGGTAPFTLTLQGQTHNCQPSYTLRNLENGRYPLSITDDHGCTASSIAVISNLPNPKIRVKSVVDAKCSYSNDGRIDVEASTLTHSLIVKWSPDYSQEGETLNNLFGGSYTALAIDEYGCTHDTTIIVGSPSPILIESIDKQNPICFGGTNGLLKVSASGGNSSPFNYLWTNDFTGFTISNTPSTGEIPSGKYAVTVTDSKGCEAKTSYILVDPPLLKPDLPSLITICSNQTYYADAGIPNVNYLWYSENGFRSNSRTASLSTSGIYNLLVTDIKGCSGRDTLNLVKSENIIDANFMIADKAYVGDTLVLIEMSWPIPQAIEWHYPASFMPVYHNDYSVYLVPQMVGNFNIGLTSSVGSCSEYIEKTITIEPAKDKRNKPISKQSIVRDVIAYPNPNRGDFSVEIALNRESDALVEVYSTYGKRLFAKSEKGLISYKIDINLFQTPGIYLVRITAGNEFRSLRVVVE